MTSIKMTRVDKRLQKQNVHFISSLNLRHRGVYRFRQYRDVIRVEDCRTAKRTAWASLLVFFKKYSKVCEELQGDIKALGTEVTNMELAS